MTSLSARRRHPMAPVAVMLLALLVLGVVYAAFAPTSRAQDESQSAELVEEGKRLFAIGCASCHGLGGEGQVRSTGEVLGPSLVGVGAAAANFQVGTGRMPMSAPGAQAPRKEVQYTDEQVDALAAYVGSLAPGPPVPTPDQYDPEQGDASHGGVLYRTNCASCHNTTGQGGALTYGKYAPALTDVEPIHMYQAMITGPQSMPVFNDQVLTSEDKRDIIAYVQTVQEAPNPGGLGIGRIGPVSEGLWAWIIGIGGLIGAAVWIGTKAS